MTLEQTFPCSSRAVASDFDLCKGESAEIANLPNQKNGPISDDDNYCHTTAKMKDDETACDQIKNCCKSAESMLIVGSETNGNSCGESTGDREGEKEAMLNNNTDSEECCGPKTDWSSIYVCSLLTFCSAVQFSLYLSSLWPYLQIVSDIFGDELIFPYSFKLCY